MLFLIYIAFSLLEKKYFEPAEKHQNGRYLIECLLYQRKFIEIFIFATITEQTIE